VGRLQREGERPRRARVAFRRGSAAEETVAGLLCTGGGDGGRRPRLWWRGGAVVGGGAAGLRSLRKLSGAVSRFRPRDAHGVFVGPPLRAGGDYAAQWGWDRRSGLAWDRSRMRFSGDY
jgi:hypothetical protein